MKKAIFTVWLGGSLAVVGHPFYTWEYWFVMLPTILLAIIFNDL